MIFFCAKIIQVIKGGANMEQNFMNDLYKQIAKQLNITTNQINAVLKLLEEGSTVPFIARYRKEVTGAL